MFKSSIFNKNDINKLNIDYSRKDPDIWIEHLIILESLRDNSHIIRELTFRRGLNIIKTTSSKQGNDNSIGHDVGKTLLTRFIRYLLGEKSYGTQNICNAVCRQYPDGYIIGKFYVKGVSWIVARPFLKSRNNQSFAFKGKNWKDIFSDTTIKGDYSLFTSFIEKSILSGLENQLFPDSNRKISWVDLLGWISRDQVCGLRKITSWRSLDTESGTHSISFNDAIFLIRIVMGLIDRSENIENNHRRELLEQKKNLINDKNQLRIKIEYNQNDIQNEYNNQDLFITNGNNLIINSLKENLDSNIKKLEKLLKDYDRPPKEIDKLINLRKDINTLEGKIKTHKEFLETERNNENIILNSDKSEIVDYITELCNKPDCPLTNKKSLLDLDKNRRLNESRSKIKEYENNINQALIEKNSLLKTLNEKQSDYDNAYRENIKTITGIINKIHINKHQIDNINEYISNTEEMDNIETKCNDIDNKINKSSETLKKFRKIYNNRLNEIINYLNIVSNIIIAPNCNYNITLDGNGLNIKPKDKIAETGQATFSGIVLAFDWTACVDSIVGNGFFPRFLIHDSPREADRELGAYWQLFNFVLKLEHCFKSKLPSFQYIITTTTPPPPELDTEPYVRCVLNSQSLDGYLLHFHF